MRTRNVISRLNRLESRFGPPPELPAIVVEYVGMMSKKVACVLRIKNGRSEYWTADGEPTTFAEIARRSCRQGDITGSELERAAEASKH